MPRKPTPQQIEKAEAKRKEELAIYRKGYQAGHVAKSRDPVRSQVSPIDLYFAAAISGLLVGAKNQTHDPDIVQRASHIARFMYQERTGGAS